MSKTAVIVGGGITGLSTAWYLQQRGIRAVVLEASAQLGGKIATLRDGDFLVEAGADSFLVAKQGARDLVREVGLAHEVITPLTSQFSIYYNGILHPVPSDFSLGVPARIAPFLRSSLFSTAGKARLLAERFIPARQHGGDESLADFVQRRMGREVLERYAEPLFAGVYGTAADALSVQSVLPQLRAMERAHGSVTAGVLHHRHNAENAQSRSPFAGLRRGMGSLVEALQERLSATTVRVQMPVQHIASSASNSSAYAVHCHNGESLQADAVVLTVPAYTASAMVRTLLPRTAAMLAAIDYSSSAVVTLACAKSDVPSMEQLSGFVVARRSSSVRITASTWSSEKWEGRAPHAAVLVRCFMGRKEDCSLPDGDIIAQAHRDMQTVLGKPFPLLQAWVHRWHNAHPLYTVGHADTVQRVEQSCKEHPIVFAGAAYKGIGIPDCIAQGKQAAARVAELLA